MTIFTAVTTFEIVHCYKCGMAFGIPQDFQERRCSDKQSFYCPAGHPQAYVGPSDRDRAQKLAGQLDMERTRRQQAEKVADYATRSRKAVSTRLKKVKARVGHGVCPCCNRTFKALADHMATQHPTYAASAEDHG